MSKVQEIEAAIQRLNLTNTELQEVRDRLDELIEDEMELAPEFQAKIEQSLRDQASGNYSRQRKGPNA